MNKDKWIALGVGLLLGAMAIGLMLAGNPGNMGLCIACFLRDSAGALKLHTAAPVQYFRPEIVGLLLGSMIISLATKEFKARGGSSPLLRFTIGFFVMIGALAFLGCPMRLVLRMSAGDLNAWIALIGFAVGIFMGVIALQKGYSLGRTHNEPKLEGVALPITSLIILIAVIAVPALFAFSEKGPGSMHANVYLSLGVALIAGALAQRSRLCMAGGFRDLFMLKDWTLLLGSIGILVSAFIVNLIANKVHFSMIGQPIAHSSVVWNILGMALVGYGSVLLGGCPLRQLILTGTGNIDSAITVLGMLIGAAFSHNFGLAGAPDTVKEGVLVKQGGISANGKCMVILGFVVLTVIVITQIRRNQALKATKAKAL